MDYLKKLGDKSPDWSAFETASGIGIEVRETLVSSEDMLRISGLSSISLPDPGLTAEACAKIYGKVVCRAEIWSLMQSHADLPAGLLCSN